MINYSQSIKISQLDELGVDISSTDYFPIVDAETEITKRLTLNGLKTLIGGGGGGGTSITSSDKQVIFNKNNDVTGSNDLTYDYINKILYVTNSLYVSESINATGVTSSLYGTSSWAYNTVSSSYALTASYVSSAVVIVQNSISASYVSGSNSELGNLVIKVYAQKSNIPGFAYGNGTESGIYLVSTSSAPSTKVGIYLAPSGSGTGNDQTDKVGIWMNGIINGIMHQYI